MDVTDRRPNASRRRRRRALALAAVAAVTGLTTGCQAGTDGGDGNGADGSGEENVSPFTGERADPGPVLAVKIDNTEAARPQVGLAEADIVYAEQVEGGLSRLVGIYSGSLPDEVGPVRSARESDLELLRQFGEPALAYSGVQTRLKPQIEQADLFPESPESAPDAYRRDAERSSPYNLFVDPAEVLDAAPDASEARDIGFRFGDAPAEGGRAAPSYNVAFPAAEFTFDWADGQDRWRVAVDGDPTEAAPATVVVQEVSVRDSELHDVLGNPSPYTETVGSGDATVLRDGQAYDARWSRPDETSGTEFTTPDGDPMRFARGPVWVVFLAR
jgi:hypothetical protein